MTRLLTEAEEQVASRPPAKPTGGPAFPEFLKVGEVAQSEGGMTLRDYFAAKALPAVISASSAGQHSAGVARGLPPNTSIEQAIAFDAYALADAMILARDK